MVEVHSPQLEIDTMSAAPPAVKEAARQGVAGTAVGLNLHPDSYDDGWAAPPPVRLSDGTLVRLFKDGEALLAAYDAIKAAKRRICLEVYIFASDETGRAFADLLCQKAREGLSVYVIYDSFGSIEADGDMFRRMRDSGVRIGQFNPIWPWECDFSWRPINRDHRKLLVIDDHIAGLGGLNIAAEYGGSWVVKSTQTHPDFWRDNAVALIGPSAAKFLESFRRSWHYIANGGRTRSAEFIYNLYNGELGVLATVPTMNSPLRPFLCRLLREARSSVFLTVAYFAPDDPLVAELCAAARRGVCVRLMLPGRCDVKILRMAAQSFYEMLMVAGVEIFERQGVVLHAKTLVVDGETCLLGSTNLDYRSIEYNCEISAIIRSGIFGAQMQRLFENDVHYSQQIRLSEWRRRPWLDRVGQWAVSRARYLL